MNAHLSSLLDKEISRKEFLGMSVLAIASVMGLGTIIKLFTGKSLGSHPQLQHLSNNSAGYGTSAYGGFKN